LISILQACCSTPSKPSWRSAGFACLLSIAGCQQSGHDEQLDFFALGTEVSVSLYDVSDAQFIAADERLRTYFADVGHDWYPWRPGELQRVNDAIANHQSVQVTPRLAGILRRAAVIETLSKGAFNAGLGRLTELWGLHELEAGQQIPDQAAIDALLESGLSLADLQWDGDMIVVASPQVMIDLGGIAKGAVLDGCVLILNDLGIHNAIVNIGGDLTVVGSVHGRPARIGIRSPTATAPIAAVDVGDGETVVTSGNYERFVEIEGRRFAHILDPRSGHPIEHSASVTVIHSDAMLADAAATALMVGGPAEFDALTQSLRLEFALLIDASGDLRLTPAMKERLNWLEQAAD
jgi:thiamine biosynthesis lipoprotein